MSLDKYIAGSDIKCDEPFDEWHPHHTAEKLKEIFLAKRWDFESYSKIGTSRNPFDLVVSYYCFFKPDRLGKYNFEPSYQSEPLMPFKSWIMNGKVWDHTNLKLGNDLSPIGIENYFYDRSGISLVDNMVDITEMAKLEGWLKTFLADSSFAIPHINQSSGRRGSREEWFDVESIEKVRAMFRKEFEIFKYNF
jgi:hypothetical protein